MAVETRRRSSVCSVDDCSEPLIDVVGRSPSNFCSWHVCMHEAYSPENCTKFGTGVCQRCDEHTCSFVDCEGYKCDAATKGDVHCSWHQRTIKQKDEKTDCHCKHCASLVEGVNKT